MEWNCSNCGREIISKEKNKFCLECWWKDLVEKIEINPESIRIFMEKYWFTFFSFYQRDVYENYDSIYMGSEDFKSITNHHSYPSGLGHNYYPETKKNKMADRNEKDFFTEYSAFLEKLFFFAKEKKIRRIRGDWRSEKNSDNELIFKVDSIIIEKKTLKELEEE